MKGDGAVGNKKMETKRKLKKFAALCLILATTSTLYFGFFCTDRFCGDWGDTANAISDSAAAAVVLEKSGKWTMFKRNSIGPSYDEISRGSVRFDIDARDVLVFLHVQKTGGTSFGKHLVQDLDLKRPCTCERKHKKCTCLRPNREENWLFSRYSTGWTCGLHADWTELTNCVDSQLDKNEGEDVKRRCKNRKCKPQRPAWVFKYFYITLLREPLSRFLSEFKHVKRGATWRNSRHWCGGRVAAPKELPNCYAGSSWKNVTADEFLNCPHNLAFNRQTRMLSDLTLIGCYNGSLSSEEKGKIMLESAKRNLAFMAFFLLTEFQKIGQYMFEETFDLRFAVPFSQHNSSRSASYFDQLRPDQLEKMRRVNSLDLELYEYAKKLMFQRFGKLRDTDPQFEERWKHLGELPVKTEFDWDDAVEPS